MKLSSGEVSILAYFSTRNDAEKARDTLKEMGFNAVQIDRVSRYGLSFNSELNNPVAGQAESQTGLTLYSADRDRFADSDVRVLEGADPSNYAMASRGYGLSGGKAFLLTAVVSDPEVSNVVNIIKHNGGTV